jgi:hypothetical protein
MIEKFPFMLRFSKHSESFFNSLLNVEQNLPERGQHFAREKLQHL